MTILTSLELIAGAVILSSAYIPIAFYAQNKLRTRPKVNKRRKPHDSNV